LRDRHEAWGSRSSKTSTEEILKRYVSTYKKTGGKDGVSNSNDAKEYQVLNSSTEATPTYCGGINFDSGFNDLTSVSEADGDNYVYMVANTTVNELKIIQGGPDGTYLDTGTMESTPLDVGYSTASISVARVDKISARRSRSDKCISGFPAYALRYLRS
jgi:hypothetical protein